MPELSVLPPVRDAGPYLEALLASLWRQTLGDFEVVAVDDGSSDGSAEALERAASGEPRLRVLRQPPCGLLPGRPGRERDATLGHVAQRPAHARRDGA